MTERDDDDKRERLAMDFEAAFEQVWLGRFPRIDQRDLRQRLFAARQVALGRPPDSAVSDEEIDDAETIARALLEYVTLLRRIKDGLRTGELPAMINEQIEANRRMS